MSCWDVVADYGLRSLGIGERLLPRDDFTLCQQVVLIGSGMIWNVYFGVLALAGLVTLAVVWNARRGRFNRLNEQSIRSEREMMEVLEVARS